MVTKTKKKGEVAVKIVLGVICALLIAYSLSIILMLAWGVLSSLKSGKDFQINVLGLPKINDPSWPKGKDDPRSSYYQLVQLKNYADLINNFIHTAKSDFFTGSAEVHHESDQTVLTMLFNSIFYAFGNGLVQAIFPAVMAYMCAKYPYKFSKALYVLVIVIMTLPIVGAYPSELTLLRNLGLYDTWHGNFIQRCSFLGMYFLVFYEYFKGMPDTYSEAAEIDGASQLTVMLRIYMPLAAKMIGSVFLIRFIFFWNDYSSIQLYMPTHFTLAYFIYYLPYYKFPPKGTRATAPMVIASGMMLALPVIVVYAFLHDKLMGNMTLGGIKG